MLEYEVVVLSEWHSAVDVFKIQCSRKCVFWLALAVLSREFPAYLKAGLVNASWYSRSGKGIKLHGFRKNLYLPVGLSSDNWWMEKYCYDKFWIRLTIIWGLFPSWAHFSELFWCPNEVVPISTGDHIIDSLKDGPWFCFFSEKQSPQSYNKCPDSLQY